MSESVITVDVILALPDEVRRQRLSLTADTGARDAIAIAVSQGLDFSESGVTADTAALGGYSVRVSDDYIVKDGDRLEVYRNLEQDPMELRRQRAKENAKR